MDDSWEERVTFLVSVLASTYGRQVSPAMLQGYLVGLAGVDLPHIERAVKRALQISKFMPTPAELRELGGDARPEDAAVAAWETACKAVSRYGWYRSVAFEDAAITATIRSLGGWQRFCERCAGEEEKWLRKEFLATYAAYRRVGVSTEAELPLAGEFERQNRLLGYQREVDAPVVLTSNWGPAPSRIIRRGENDAKMIVYDLASRMDVSREVK